MLGLNVGQEAPKVFLCGSSADAGTIQRVTGCYLPSYPIWPAGTSADLGVLPAPGLLPVSGRAGTMAVRWTFRGRAWGGAGGRGCSASPAQVMPGPGTGVASLSWIGEERIAVGGVPAAGSVTGLAGRGVTHVVNCRSREEALMGGDLAAERTAFGAARVAHAPMRDLGLRQRPRLWAQAALFAARVLDDPAGGAGADSLHRGPPPLAHDCLRGAAAARAYHRPGRITGAHVPARRGTRPGLYPQRRAVARTRLTTPP